MSDPRSPQPDASDASSASEPAVASALLDHVATLEAENARLRQRLDETAFVEVFARALREATLAGTIVDPVPHSQLLELIVSVAARVLKSRAASLSLLDEGTDELVFEVAVGEGSSAVKQFRVPVGYGIAGRVAQSGQPILSNDVANDPRHARDIAQGSGLLPRNLLCVPLFLGDHLIGVVEVVDKMTDTGFDAEDMQLLEVFARQAAVAIEQSRIHQDVTALVAEIVAWLRMSVDEQQDEALAVAAGPFAAGLEGDVAFRRALELARLVNQIAQRGEDDALRCQQLLRDYLRAPAESRADLAAQERD